MAQAYNHMILPLANTRDKTNADRWGFEDFVSRFGRLPEGMWLPETAVDLETLELMAEAGHVRSRFSRRTRRRRSGRLMATQRGRTSPASKIDPTSRLSLARRRAAASINLFFYDGPISQAVAFEKLLDNGEKFATRLTGRLFRLAAPGRS